MAAACVTPASARAERQAAAEMVGNRAVCKRRIRVAADKAYDEVDFVERLRGLGATPQPTQYTGQRRSAIDRRTTRHPSYATNQRGRKHIEKIFGWLKQIGGQRRTIPGHRTGGLDVYLLGGRLQPSANGQSQPGSRVSGNSTAPTTASQKKSLPKACRGSLWLTRIRRTNRFFRGL